VRTEPLHASPLAVGLPSDVFAEIALILVVSALAGLLAERLRQPVIVAFVAVGVLVGPSVLGVVEPGSELELFAELGVALLLFVVGLQFRNSVLHSLQDLPYKDALEVLGHLLAAFVVAVGAVHLGPHRTARQGEFGNIHIRSLFKMARLHYIISIFA